MEDEIKIFEMPIDLKIEGIAMVAKGCVNIAYHVAKKNPEIDIIEGVVIIFDKENRATAVAHMWNRHKEKDFDVTYEKVWKDTDEMIDTKELKYYQTQQNDLSQFIVGKDNDFSEQTKLDVKEINRIILEKAKK
jgi:hypothetical protein